MTDYISREAAIEKIREAGCTDCGGSSGTICGFCDFGNAVRLVNGLPAADVEPVRHGNWNIQRSRKLTLCLVCSVCGRKVDNGDLGLLLELGEYGVARHLYPYCHCGAKMDLEDDNGT